MCEKCEHPTHDQECADRVTAHRRVGLYGLTRICPCGDTEYPRE